MIRLTVEAETAFQRDLKGWLDRTEGQPKPVLADFAREFWMMGRLAKLPHRDLVALEVQRAEQLARDCGLLTP